MTTLDDVLAYIKTHDTIRYQAPLDTVPGRVNILRYTIDNQTPSLSRMTVWTPATKTLHWVIAEHLERFVLPGPGIEIR